MKIEIELDNLTEEEQKTALLWSNRSVVYWTPKFGEYYFSLGPDGAINEVQNYENAIDAFNLETGNFFRNEEEAKEHCTRLKMQQLWEKLSIEAGEDKNQWDGEHKHYFACWDCIEKRVGYLFHNECKDGLICFPTEKSIKAAIVELGEENVKKYILGVTELHQLLTEVEVEDDEDDV